MAVQAVKMMSKINSTNTRFGWWVIQIDHALLLQKVIRLGTISYLNSVEANYYNINPSKVEEVQKDVQ